MTDDPNIQEEIARLLREQGPVDAPADLADSVMDEVRRSPRGRRPVRGPWIQRAARWGVAAAALVAIGVGLSRLDLGGSGSTSSSAGGTSAGPEEQALSKAADGVGSGAQGTAAGGVRKFHVSRELARTALGDLWRPTDAADGRIVVTLSPSQFRAYSKRLHAYSGSLTSQPGTVTVILRRSP